MVAQVTNTIMPMVNDLRQRQDQDHQLDNESWTKLLEVRLNRIEDAQRFFEVALGLRRLTETVVLRRTHSTTEREMLALERTYHDI
jgi:hypothetical protein